jgi:hypothetical protein
LPSARCSRDEQPAISTVYEMIFRAAQRRSRVPSTACPCPFALVSGAGSQALSNHGGTRPDAEWAKTAASMIQ